jgi:ribosomal protein S18
LIANGDTDVSTLLAQVNAPTLVMHSRDDAGVPFDQGRRLAAGIPRARFVPLPSGNHLILEDEPAFPRFLQEIRKFISNKNRILPPSHLPEFVAVHESVPDAVDGSSTGTRVPKMGAPIRLP